MADRIVHPNPVLREIAAERSRQHAKWGQQDHANGTGDVEDINASEDAKRATHEAASEGRCTWRLILAEEVCEAFAESDPAALRAELVQVAAVAAQWIEAIDRAALSELAEERYGS